MPTELLDTVVVKSGDTLSSYAERYYGHASKYPLIFEANRDVIEDADDLFDGQSIRIPKPPVEQSAEPAASTVEP